MRILVAALPLALAAACAHAQPAASLALQCGHLLDTVHGKLLGASTI
ncbi:MAG: amidohydrolase family protein, partial [Rhodanobacteraceae bacterium]|nr:amidohydrolase family protein [Rhodanobacteraceae bacterium]